MKETVIIDGSNITIDINDNFSQMDKMRLAARMPDELVEAAETADDAGDFDFDMTVDVINYFENVLKETTQLDNDTIDDMSCHHIGKLASAVLNAIFEDVDDDNSRRIRRVRATQDSIEAIFKGELAVVAGMPDDASMENFHYDPSRDELQFVFSSSEWSEIAEGAKIPLVQAHVIQMSGDV